MEAKAAFSSRTWPSAIAALMIAVAGCSAPPESRVELPAQATAPDYNRIGTSREALIERIDRLETDMAQLRIDYSALRPELEQVIVRDGSLAYRVNAIEETLGFTTASIGQAPPEAKEDAPAPRSASPPVAVSYGVHLASYREEAALKKGWRDLVAANADLLAGLEAHIRLHDAGRDGTYRRLVAGPVGDAAAADRLCRALKARGTWCQPLPLSPSAAGSPERSPAHSSGQSSGKPSRQAPPPS